jgi:hypothetical protein
MYKKFTNNEKILFHGSKNKQETLDQKNKIKLELNIFVFFSE